MDIMLVAQGTLLHLAKEAEADTWNEACWMQVDPALQQGDDTRGASTSTADSLEVEDGHHALVAQAQLLWPGWHCAHDARWRQQGCTP